MNRMRQKLLALASAAFTVAFATFTAIAAPTRPNVLLIISDDQAWADYGFMGHPHIQTPHLDRLAAQSLTFERGYSPVPLCRPSLASIATGLYPHQHGVTGNDPDAAGQGRQRHGRARQSEIRALLRHHHRELPPAARTSCAT